MKQIKRLIKYILIGGAVSVVVYGLSQTIAYYPVLSIQNKIDDSLYRNRFIAKDADTKSSEQIVIVDIDDDSMKELGYFNRSWPRSLYFGRLIGNLKKDGARLVFLDVLLKGEGSYLDNKILADSLRSSGNVISGYYLNLDSVSKRQHPMGLDIKESFFELIGLRTPGTVEFLKSDRIDFSYHDLIMSSELVGYTNYVPDFDGVLRHIPLFIAHKQILSPSVALQMWLYMKGLQYTDADISTTGIRFDEVVIPTDRHSYMRINYRYAGIVHQYISFVDVLYGNFDSGTFRDKIVMVGSSSPRLNDLKKIPGNHLIPGVEIHAAALSTLLHEDFVRLIPEKIHFLITLLCGMCAGIVFSFAHPLKAGLPYTLGFPLVLYIASMICFSTGSFLLNISVPSLAVVVIYLLRIAYKNI